MDAFDGVPGQLERPVVGLDGLSGPAEPAQQFGADDV